MIKKFFVVINSHNLLNHALELLRLFGLVFKKTI